jgi:triosephosphate isomerase
MDSPVRIGAQNMHFEMEGAYTGEISAVMLNEIGVAYCVIGHSERRQYFAETSEIVNWKLRAAFSAGIVPIMCVGETLEERDASDAFSIVGAHIAEGLAGILAEEVSSMVIAYEPVWAIGTGRTATPDQAQEMCAFVRDEVRKHYGAEIAAAVRIQYGGSVKPVGATEILNQPDIDGALVGGASLIADQFFEICKS